MSHLTLQNLGLGKHPDSSRLDGAHLNRDLKKIPRFTFGFEFS